MSPPPAATLRFGNDFDAGLDAVVVQLRASRRARRSVADRELHDTQLERLAAAIGDAKVAVHRLPVQRSLQERLRGYDGDLQGLRRLCRRRHVNHECGRSRAGQ